jgi:hypothetical protein
MAFCVLSPYKNDFEFCECGWTSIKRGGRRIVQLRRAEMFALTTRRAPDYDLGVRSSNLSGAAQRLLKTHSSDQLSHLSGDPRPALGRAEFPSPIAGKALAMPAHDSLGLTMLSASRMRGVTTIEPDEQGAVDPAQSSEDVQLMPQYQDFGFQPRPRPEEVAQHANEQEADC